MYLSFFAFRRSSLRDNFYYNKYYVFWSKLILLELVPILSIILLNALILAKTLKAAKFRKKFGHIGGGGNNVSSIDHGNLKSSGVGARSTSVTTSHKVHIKMKTISKKQQQQQQDEKKSKTTVDKASQKQTRHAKRAFHVMCILTQSFSASVDQVADVAANAGGG
jgi:hypothetical protein